MKKLIAIPLLFLYLVAVSGAMIQIHYCGNRIASWNINKKSEKCCCEADGHNKPLNTKIKKKDCCSNKVITLKISETQNSITKATNMLVNIAVTDVVSDLSFPEFDSYATPEKSIGYRSNAPPGRWQNIPLYKLHSNFTYYG